MSGQAAPAPVAFAAGLLDRVFPKEVASYASLKAAAIGFAARLGADGVALSGRRLSLQPVPFDIDRAEVRCHVREPGLGPYQVGLVRICIDQVGRLTVACVCGLACPCVRTCGRLTVACVQLGPGAASARVQAASASLARSTLLAKIAATKASLPPDEQGGLAKRRHVILEQDMFYSRDTKRCFLPTSSFVPSYVTPRRRAWPGRATRWPLPCSTAPKAWRSPAAMASSCSSRGTLPKRSSAGWRSKRRSSTPSSRRRRQALR